MLSIAFVLFLIVILLLSTTSESRMSIPGGHHSPREASSEEQSILDSVKSACESSTGNSYTTFKALKYRSQVVAGTNYIIEAQISDNECLHVKVFKPLPHTGEAAQFVTVKGPLACGSDLVPM